MGDVKVKFLNKREKKYEENINNRWLAVDNEGRVIEIKESLFSHGLFVEDCDDEIELHIVNEEDQK